MDKTYIAKLLEERTIRNPVSGCLEFVPRRGNSTTSYGKIIVGWKTYYAHRLAAFVHMGFNLDSDLAICHRCDNPRCCDPNHLFIGTLADNNEDMATKDRCRNQNSDKTHCIRGHALTASNIYWHREKGYLKRKCRECRRIQSQQFEIRKKQLRRSRKVA